LLAYVSDDDDTEMFFAAMRERDQKKLKARLEQQV